MARTKQQGLKQLTPSINLLSPSARMVRDNIGLFFVLYIAPFLLMNGLFAFEIGYQVTVRPDGSLKSIDISQSFWAYVFLIAVYTLIAYGPLVYSMVNLAGGKQPTLAESLREGFKFVPRLFLLSAITGLVVFGGLLLFIVPGIILLRRYYLAPYYLVDRDIGVLEAMAVSARETKPFSGYVYGLFGVDIFFGLISVVPLLGAYASSVLGVLYTPAPALRYQEIKKAKK